MSKFCGEEAAVSAPQRAATQPFKEKSGGPSRTSAEWRVLRLHRHVEWFILLAGDQFVIGGHLEQGSVRFPAIDVDQLDRHRAHHWVVVACQQRQLQI